jgi:hypothetical protein
MPPHGRSLPLSLPRRLIGDLLHFARQVPGIPVQRVMNVADLREARQRLPQRPAWCVLFTKAFAVVAGRFPELRRSYLSFPWGRLYEHTDSVASVAVERSYRGENAVLFGQLRAPDRLSLAELDARLRRLQRDPIEEVGSFRRALFVSGLPWPLRRFGWWLVLQAWGRQRARHFGTFGVSVYASAGAESLHPISPLTIVLNYGVIQPDGAVAVRLIYDHRVLDGSTVARALAALEEVLQHEILAELRASAAPTVGDAEAAA